MHIVVTILISTLLSSVITLFIYTKVTKSTEAPIAPKAEVEEVVEKYYDVPAQSRLRFVQLYDAMMKNNCAESKFRFWSFAKSFSEIPGGSSMTVDFKYNSCPRIKYWKST